MAVHHLLRCHKSSTLTAHSRFASQCPVTASPPSLATPTAPPTMLYDRLAEFVMSKLKRLETPNPLFLRHASPLPALADHAAIVAAPETRITTLPNGLRVATESSLAARTATVGVWIDTGSRFESEETNGVAHLINHMICQGMGKKKSGLATEEEIENVGGHLNACLSREQSAYYAKVMCKEVPKALEVLANIIQNSCFDNQRIDGERGMILRKIEEMKRPAEEVIFDHLHATAFQYTPLGRSILGPPKNIKMMTKDQIQNYISTQYAAHRMVISAAGAVKHEDIVEQVKKLFTKLSANPTTTSQLVESEPAVFTGSEVRIIDDDVPLAQFAVAFHGASWTDPDSIALMVMRFMLGSWTKKNGAGKHKGSELVQRVGISEIAEKVMAFNINYKDTGMFGVYAEAEPDCLSDLAYAIMYELSRLCYRVSEADVIRAQNQLKSSLLLNIDGTSPIAEDIGHQLLTYGRRIPFAELFARIDAVDANTIKHVANRFICDRDIAIAAMGPIQGLPDYNWFRRRTYMLRY